MLVNRFREQFRLQDPQAEPFVPCPVAGLIPAPQLAMIQEIYRLAIEQAREQLAPPQIPEFSMN